MNIEFADGWVASSMASRGNLSIFQPVWKCQSNRTHFPQFPEKQQIFGQPPPYRRWILIMPCSSAWKTMHYFWGELHWRLPCNLASSLIPTMGNFMTPAKERGWRKGMKMTRFRGACSTIPTWIQVMYGCLGADSIGIVLGAEKGTVTTHMVAGLGAGSCSPTCSKSAWSFNNSNDPVDLLPLSLKSSMFLSMFN